MLDQSTVKKIIAEIEGQGEVDRRAKIKRRHDIYKDGGKAFLIEKILREFGEDALSEMRITPINLLKKIVDKRAAIYKRPPVRLAKTPADQKLVAYYERKLALDQVMAKANRYMALASNTVVYVKPKDDGYLEACVIPAYQYSLVPNEKDQTKIDVFVFSSFAKADRVAPNDAPTPATGVQGFNEQRTSGNGLVASNERTLEDSSRYYIFWSKDQHLTADSTGNVVMDPTMGEEQFLNPLNGVIPVVNVARDRDNEPWATQGEDMVDLALALQIGWTDVMTIAKHQGFSILTITSEDEPKKLAVGVNKAVWLKINNSGGPQPSIGYVQGNSPLDQYKSLLQELLALLLTTNNMEPNAMGGSGQVKNFTSGFHALISMADSLEAVEQDKPIMRDAEHGTWEAIKAWHNWMFDAGILKDEARMLGKFSDDFQIEVVFADIKPLESEDERINRVKALMDMGLITKKDALKKLHPELSKEALEAKLQELEDEKAQGMAKAQEIFGSPAPTQDPQETEDDAEEEDESEGDLEEDLQEEDGARR